MYSDKPTSPFGTAFNLPTLEQMISVCVEWGADNCNVYVPEPYCDRVTLRFEAILLLLLRWGMTIFLCRFYGDKIHY